jgi:hypothetical protein
MARDFAPELVPAVCCILKQNLECWFDSGFYPPPTTITTTSHERK